MGSDKDQNNKNIIPSRDRGLARYSSKLIVRGLDLAKALEQSEAVVKADRKAIGITKPQTQTWRCLYTFAKDLGSVSSVAISPDSLTLASGISYTSEYTETKLWNIQTGEVLSTLPGCRLDAISSGWQTIASSGYGGVNPWNIYIWDVYTGEILKVLFGHSGTVYSLAYSLDGQTLASGSHAADGTIKVWDVGTGELIQTLYGHVGKSVFSLAISPVGQTLASFDSDGTIIIWNVFTGELLNAFSSGYSECITFSPDGQILANGSDGTIKIWNPHTGELLRTLSGQEGDVSSIAFSPDGQTLTSSSYGEIKIWNLYIGKLLHTLTGYSGSVNSVAFSYDGQTLASGGSKYKNDDEYDDEFGIIQIWRLSS